MIGSSNDETNFPHKLLLTDTKICKDFANGSNGNIKFSKTQFSKMIQSGEFISLVHNSFVSKNISEFICKRIKEYRGQKIGKNTFVDAGLSLLGKKIKKGTSSITTSGITLINNEIKDIIKYRKSLENREILLKRTTRRVISQEGGFFSSLGPLMTAGLQ